MFCCCVCDFGIINNLWHLAGASHKSIITTFGKYCSLSSHMMSFKINGVFFDSFSMK